jgi:hypothetical protein
LDAELNLKKETTKINSYLKGIFGKIVKKSFSEGKKINRVRKITYGKLKTNRSFPIFKQIPVLRKY